jgi:hypothetical protein
MIRWLSSWATTLRIMLCERETYRYLIAAKEHDPGDFMEVGPPHEQ